MAILKNTADLLAEAAANLPDNSTQEISPQDVREMVENIAFSSYNKITDAPLVGLQEFSTSLNYNTGKAIIRNGDIYVANTDVTAGAFDALEWDLVTLPSKQNALISGTNIKTINGVSVLGSGNLTVQETLVSGTNIKTINGVSVLGSGDLTVSDTTLFDGGKTLGGNVTNDLNGNIFALNNGSVILNGASKIGSESISLQGETYIQRASTSSADTVLSLLDNVGTELWDWRANGHVNLGDDIHANLTNSFVIGNMRINIGSGSGRFCFGHKTEMGKTDDVLDANTVFGYNSSDNAVRIKAPTATSVFQRIMLYGSSTNIRQVVNDQGVVIGSGLSEVLTTASANLEVRGDMIVNGSSKIGSEDVSLQGDTLIGNTGDSVGFYGVTPVARATTGISGATFVSNIGINVHENSTFGGYTLAQIAQALQDIGILT